MAPALGLILLAAGCAPTVAVSPSVLPAVSAAVAAVADTGAASTATAAATSAPAEAVSGVFTGNASWYGPGFAGRHTANGEIFDPNQLTAAHRTLPFDTRVRVTFLTTGQSVTVRINDRGPFKDNRIIDLSRAAADTIGLTGSGVGQVRLEVLGGSGVMTGAASSDLTPFEVVARGRLLGELLLVSSAQHEDRGPVMVRVIGTDVPADTGADLLMSEQLFQQLGTSIIVSSD